MHHIVLGKCYLNRSKRCMCLGLFSDVINGEQRCISDHIKINYSACVGHNEGTCPCV